MGVDVSPEVMIGLWFDSEEEATNYIEKLKNKVYRSEFHEETLPFDDWQYCMEGGLNFVHLTEYQNRGGCFGISVDREDMKDRPDGLIKYYEKLRSILPEEDWGKIEPHFWARYC